MAKPIVAIVGRPNVGKSTLVNRIAQKKEAIVHESRGVTRDRSYHEADWCGREFTLVDTGGIETGRSDDAFAGRIREQAEAACQEADVIIFVVDATTGVTEEDETVARILRRAGKPVFLVANKLDNPADDKTMWDFYALGLGEPRPISAVHGHGTGDLLDEVVAALPEPAEEPEYPEDALRVAIIGRPNVGKSSITNRFAGKNRSIVSDVAGTTRDALDVIVERGDKRYRLVDTAGMRKRNLVHEDVEYYSLVRGLRAIDEADVCLLVVDASEGVTEQDQKIAGLAIERGCALIILLNKWDLVTDDHAREEVMQSVARRMTFAPGLPSSAYPRSRDVRSRRSGPSLTVWAPPTPARCLRARSTTASLRCASVATPLSTDGSAFASSMPTQPAIGRPPLRSSATSPSSSMITTSATSKIAFASSSISKALLFV